VPLGDGEKPQTAAHGVCRLLDIAAYFLGGGASPGGSSRTQMLR
jgi:hypothetical protein